VGTTKYQRIRIALDLSTPAIALHVKQALDSGIIAVLVAAVAAVTLHRIVSKVEEWDYLVESGEWDAAHTTKLE
jgi:hypothetical protein